MILKKKSNSPMIGPLDGVSLAGRGPTCRKSQLGRSLLYPSTYREQLACLTSRLLLICRDDGNVG